MKWAVYGGCILVWKIGRRGSEEKEFAHLLFIEALEKVHVLYIMLLKSYNKRGKR